MTKPNTAGFRATGSRALERSPVALTPRRTWGGKGCGAHCDFCGVVVSSSEVEYEVEAELEGEPVTLHFHPRCHDAWKAQREAAGFD